jgi:integrase
VDHIRGKTGIRGRYVIPEPVGHLLLHGMEKNGELAFLTADGKPLVWYGQEGKRHKTDSVAQMWRRLLRKCPQVRRLGFKYLRKTGATLIGDLTGSDRLAELYLSHSGQSVARKHYLGRTEEAFDQLADAIGKMRECLDPMFDGSAVIPDKATKSG